MFADSTVSATIAVKDIEAAKQFYGGTLGLKQTDENPAGVTYSSGQGALFVYPSQYAGTNQATYAAWNVDDVSEVVEELKGKGIVFEKYDIPGGEKEGDGTVLIFMGAEKAAWFKDPDGNILSVGSKI